MPPVPPEFQLLLDCASRACGVAIAFPDAARLDPYLLLALARRHRVLPLLRRYALQIPGSEVFIAPLEDELAPVMRASLALTAAMLDLHAKFSAEDIVAVPLKGPALASQLYGGETLRSFDDIDFLIRPADFMRAHELLKRAGYEPMFDLARFQWRMFPDFFDEVAYRHRETDLEIDLQWRACSPGYSFAPDTSRWFSRLGKESVSGREVPALHADDLSEFLLIHGSKHGWARLAWLLDLAKCALPNASTAALRMRAYAAALLQRLLRLPVPSNDGIDAGLLDRIIAGMHADSRPLGNYDLFPELMDSPRDRQRYKFEVTFRPTPWEWQLVPLPRMLACLYYVLRPLRISARAAARSFVS